MIKRIINRIRQQFNNKFASSQFEDYKDYVDIQYRCEPKEFMDHRPKIVSGLIYALEKLDGLGVEQKVRLEEGKAKGQLVENRIVILDAGVRDGWTIEFLNSLGYPNVVGVELLPDYVAYAQKKGRNVVPGDLHELPFEDEHFDFVHSRHTLEHCLDPIKVLNELLRVLKKGGALYCSFPIVEEPHGKHTLAIPNLKSLFKILKQLDYEYEPVYVGRTSQTTVIPEGNEVIIFIQRR